MGSGLAVELLRTKGREELDRDLRCVQRECQELALLARSHRCGHSGPDDIPTPKTRLQEAISEVTRSGWHSRCPEPLVIGNWPPGGLFRGRHYKGHSGSPNALAFEKWPPAREFWGKRGHCRWQHRSGTLTWPALLIVDAAKCLLAIAKFAFRLLGFCNEFAPGIFP